MYGAPTGTSLFVLRVKVSNGQQCVSEFYREKFTCLNNLPEIT